MGFFGFGKKSSEKELDAVQAMIDRYRKGGT